MRAACITDIDAARSALDAAWNQIVDECLQVLGSELHYQAMVYHALRSTGHVPVSQLGMNVKQNIKNPHTDLFRALRDRRHVDYRSGFEPIPDVAIFSPGLGADWRRRNAAETLRHMLLAVEIKCSERASKRLQRSEVTFDIQKLQAHRAEARAVGSEFHAVMLIIDTAPNERERMTAWSLEECKIAAASAAIELRYFSPHARFVQH